MRLSFFLIAIAFSIQGIAQDDTLFIRKKSAKFLSVKRLWIGDQATKRKVVSNKLRKYKNVETLSFRPIIVRFVRPLGGGSCIMGYHSSKISTLPSWISELKKLQDLDLIGLDKINYTRELPKLLGLKELKRLSIDPDEFTDDLLKVIEMFTSLDTLKIRATLTSEQLSELKSRLPNCKITTGIYADY